MMQCSIMMHVRNHCSRQKGNTNHLHMCPSCEGTLGWMFAWWAWWEWLMCEISEGCWKRLWKDAQRHGGGWMKGIKEWGIDPDERERRRCRCLVATCRGNSVTENRRTEPEGTSSSSSAQFLHAFPLDVSHKTCSLIFHLHIAFAFSVCAYVKQFAHTCE